MVRETMESLEVGVSLEIRMLLPIKTSISKFNVFMLAKALQQLNGFL